MEPLALTLPLAAGVLVAVCAFVCEYVDSTLGMGYGTTLTPLFLLMGYSPLEIVPAILLSELVTGLLAGVFHHREGNVNFWPRSREILRIHRILQPGHVAAVRRSLPLHLKVAMLLGVCSAVGAVAAVVVAVQISKFWLKMYIGVLVLSMGLLILLCRKRQFGFSWKRITALGVLASFNKGLSGGGYGPLITSGQILSGVDGRSAVGITSLAEALTCAVGVVLYYAAMRGTIDWRLAPWIVAGAVLSVPLSAKSVKLVPAGALKLGIAIFTIVLGLWTLVTTLGLV